MNEDKESKSRRNLGIGTTLSGLLGLILLDTLPPSYFSLFILLYSMVLGIIGVLTIAESGEKCGQVYEFARVLSPYSWLLLVPRAGQRLIRRLQSPLRQEVNKLKRESLRLKWRTILLNKWEDEDLRPIWARDGMIKELEAKIRAGKDRSVGPGASTFQYLKEKPALANKNASEQEARGG